jgi:hypothetical protein
MRHLTSQASKIGRALAVAAIALGVASVSHAARADQSSPPDPNSPQTISSQVVTATGTIQKIEKDQRVVVIKGSEGNTVDVKAGPNVNLDKLKVGDRVNAAYYEEVAVALHKAGEPAQKTSQSVTEHGGVTAQQTTTTAKVVSVDMAKNMVVLKGPQGNMKSLTVKDPDLQAQLSKIKPGDNVDVTYTQAVAVSVEPAKM